MGKNCDVNAYTVHVRKRALQDTCTIAWHQSSIETLGRRAAYEVIYLDTAVAKQLKIVLTLHHAIYIFISRTACQKNRAGVAMTEQAAGTTTTPSRTPNFNVWLRTSFPFRGG
jgi:hypothetical protein